MTIKQFLTTALGSLSLLCSAQAVTIDLEAFGADLNGWRKDRTASYTIHKHPYLTYRPTMTPNSAGGVFISTRVDHKPPLGKKMTSYIELNYADDGTLLTAQIKVMAGALRLNTGAISRPALAPTTGEGGAPAPDPEPWLDPTTRMVNELFTALDAEFAKLSKRDQDEKKDVFSRVFGKGHQTADLSAALRHNLNLLIGHTR